MCEEYETFHDRTVQPVVRGQSSSSSVPSVIKTEVLLDCDDSALKYPILQQYGERIEKLSQQDKLSKFCMDARFLNVVEIGQYFVTKDTAEFSEFRTVASREYILPRDEEASQPKGWIQGNTKMGPVLEVTTSYLWGKYGVEIRIMSMNEENSHSWIRISHGLFELVADLNNNEQATSKMQFEEYALRLNVGDFASRSTLPLEPYLLGKELGPMLNQEIFTLGYAVSKKLIHHLRRARTQKEDDGAVQFWRSKDNLQKHFQHCHHWSDDKWKKSMAGGGGTKKRYQYCQGHSGRNLIDPTLQDNVFIPNNFFQYIYHVGCAINLHSIINSGLILGGKNLNNRQTVFFLPFDPRDKDHKDPEKIDLSVPRRAQYLHNAWKRHQDAVYWVDHGQKP